MIKFEYEDVIEYLKADIQEHSDTTYGIIIRLKEISKYKYDSCEINESNTLIRFYHLKYQLGYWSINYNQFKTSLRQKRINDFLKHTDHDKI